MNMVYVEYAFVGKLDGANIGTTARKYCCISLSLIEVYLNLPFLCIEYNFYAS